MHAKDKTSHQCSVCGCTCAKDGMLPVDGQPICMKCLYGNTKPLTLRPIGIVTNDKSRSEKNFGTTGGDISEIKLLPSMQQFMKCLEEETHLTVVWHLHLSKSVSTSFARGWDHKVVGPFASRSPDRPTPVAITDVELLQVKDTTLVVRGLDAVNGTPVLDIKVSKRSLRKASKTNSEKDLST